MASDPETEKRSRPVYNLVMHLHPRKVSADTLRFTLSFGLGGMAALLFVIQVFTGLLLKFHYIPAPENAYNSVLNINNNLLFGRLTHNIHHWSAILLLWITFLHMLRVLFTSAYRKPRHATWIFGILLLILVVMSNFTGYLLPWDQLSYWAVTVSTSLLEYIPAIGAEVREALLGGQEVGSATLSHFFNLHTGIIPLLMILLMAHHFWRIRKAGGLIKPGGAMDSQMVDTNPNLVAREFVTALVLISLLLLLATFADAPLRERANPSFSPNPAKAPWYFMGLQELLIHFHPFFVVVIFPAILITGITWMPFIKTDDNNQGIWFLSGTGRKAGIYSGLTAFILTIAFILVSEVLPDPETIVSSLPSFVTTGLFPFIVVSLSIFGFMKYLHKSLSLNRSEYIQSVIIILVVSYSVLSLAGIFFRGEGMSLIWPWQL